MASITVIGTGRNKRYKVMYELPPVFGERKRKSKTFPPGTPKSVVDDFKRQMEINLATGEFTTNKCITLQKYVEDVYFNVYTKYLSVTTVDNYRKLYTSNKPYCIKSRFGEYKMKDISRRMVQQYANDLSDIVSSKTVRSYLFWLSAVFESAISEEIIKPHANPTRHIKLPPKKKPKIEAYTVDEVNKILKLAQDDIISKLIIGLGCLAGLRRGEMAGLRWEDVDLDGDNPEIHIEQTRVIVDDKEYVKTPKTEAGNRTIPIPHSLVIILREALHTYRVNKLKLGKDFVNSGYVISLPNGEAYRPDGISTHYQRFIHRAEENHGIPYKSLHKLRHSYATILIDGGANPKVVQRNLGHEDVQMTLGTYAHAYSERQRSEVDKLDTVIDVGKENIS